MSVKEIPVIKEHLEELIELCRKHKVEKLYLFGSLATGTFDPEKSDIDLIVEMESMPPIEKGEHLLALWDELESLFDRKVDLLTDQPVKNPFLKDSIEKTRVLLYDRESEKIPV